MARTMSVPCRRDLACYRNDGHPGDCAYPRPETVPQPATLPALDVSQLAKALHYVFPSRWNAATEADIAADIAREYAALEEPTPVLLRLQHAEPLYTEDDPDWSAMVSPISEKDGGHDDR